ncbi:MAG: endolytic transglycosylase MltG [Stenotrophobium sp.]
MRLLLLLVLLIASAAWWLWQDFTAQLHEALPITQKLRVEVPVGKSLGAFLASLHSEGVMTSTRQTFYLRVDARLMGKSTALKAGEYELTPGMSAEDVLLLLLSGRILLHEQRITEGWTFAQLRAVTNQNPDLDHRLQGLSDEQVMAIIGEPALAAEGQFFPDTYLFPKGTTDEAFLRRAHAALKSVLMQEWDQREADLPLQTPDQALILASLIEKETAAPAERPEIAGVFLRRLQQGIRLQTDPAVIYGLGAKYDGKLHRRDLDTDTPYNTYTRDGLPPTPICMPGRASIHAALHPAAGTALYFVARGDGSHQFSDTLQEHDAAVRKFQLKKPVAPPAVKHPKKAHLKKHDKKHKKVHRKKPPEGS